MAGSDSNQRITAFESMADAFTVNDRNRRCVFCAGIIPVGQLACTSGGSVGGVLVNSRAHTHCMALVRNAPYAITSKDFADYVTSLWHTDLDEIFQRLPNSESIFNGYAMYDMFMDELHEEALHEELTNTHIEQKIYIPKNVRMDFGALDGKESL